jgi:transcription initiation factor TFIIH subunit 3
MQYLMFGLAAGCTPRAPGQFSSEEKKKGAGKASQQGTAPLASVADLLNSPSAETVDFRAACFCHRRVVDTGYVCSVCLSIFCEVPEEAECLTCGTKLQLGSYGKKPVVKFRGKVVSNGA